MRVTNVGGSLTTALVLSLVAWGVRLLRAKNILRPVERPAKPATRVPSKALYGLLSPAAFLTLVNEEVLPCTLVDVRSPEEVAEAPAESFGVTHRVFNVAEAELSAVMRPRGKVWEERFELPLPSVRQTIVFLSGTGASAGRCAGIAANLGYMRCAVLHGGLQSLAEGATAIEPAGLLISRDAVAVLLERLGSENAASPSVLLIDVRRPDERVFYGSIPGSFAIPAEQFPRAMAMGPEEWFRTFRFMRPQPHQLVLLHSRADKRARWAARLAEDAGFGRCLVLQGGTAGWRLDTDVKVYPAYDDGQPPPAPQPFLLEAVDAAAGEEQLALLL